MEFKNREESTFWQLMMVAATRHGDVSCDVFSDKAVLAFRERMKVVAKTDLDILNKFDELLGDKAGKGKDPLAILGLSPPKKDPSSDPTN